MVRRSLGLLLALLFVSAFAVAARAEPAEPAPVTSDLVASCAARHDEARLLRLNEQWHEARAAMTRCADESCPLAIRSDCSAWLEELAQVLPTVLVVVERDDAGKQPIRLELDGEPREAPVETGPLELLPGRHVLRFTLDAYPPVERTLELAKGEKNRLVFVRFVREPAPAKPAPPPAPPGPERSRPIPVATYLAAAGALVAFTASGVLLASALSSRDAARESCAPQCRDGERRAIDHRLLAADLTGGAGLLLGGVAVYTFVTRPEVPDPSSRSALQGARPLFGASLRGRF